MLDPLADRGLLPVSVDQFVDKVRGALLATITTLGTRILGSIAPLVGGLIGAAITAFGIGFIAVYLLADARQLHCGLLRAAPRRYRRDLRDLWDAFVFRLSRYLGGLTISLAVQGVLSGLALYFIGVPYPVLLGAWVSLTALIPYLGAWIGGAPAVLLALSISPATALLTLVLFVAIQQLESNLLTPRIQGLDRLHSSLCPQADALLTQGIQMKRILFAAAFAGVISVVIAAPALAAPQTYVLDQDHSYPRFSYNHMGFSKQILRFNKTSGEVVLDKEARTASVDITIDMNSIDTGVAAFDKHMVSADIFDTARFPTATFRSSQVTFDGDRPAKIVGELTIKGITRALTLNVTSFTNKEHPMLKKDAIGANASGVIRRSEFDAGYGVPDVGDEVQLDIALEAVKK